MYDIIMQTTHTFSNATDLCDLGNPVVVSNLQEERMKMKKWE